MRLLKISQEKNRGAFDFFFAEETRNFYPRPQKIIFFFSALNDATEAIKSALFEFYTSKALMSITISVF